MLLKAEILFGANRDKVTVLSRLDPDDVPEVVSSEIRRHLGQCKDSYRGLDDASRLPIEIGLEGEP